MHRASGSFVVIRISDLRRVFEFTLSRILDVSGT